MLEPCSNTHYLNEWEHKQATEEAKDEVYFRSETYEQASARLSREWDEIRAKIRPESRLENLLKCKPFPVVDLLNWSDKEKDEAVIAYLQDMGERGFAMTYAASGNYDKNRHYQNYEGAIRDLIDKFNEDNL